MRPHLPYFMDLGEYMKMQSNDKVAEFVIDNWEFEPIYNEYLRAKELKEFEKRQARVFLPDITIVYPSMLWGCYFRQFLQTKMPRAKKLEVLKILHRGDILHEHLVAEVLKWKYGRLLKDERGLTISIVPFEIYMRGYIDDLLIFELPDRHGEVIFVSIEVKTTAAQLKYMKAPKLEHIQQVTPYLIANGHKKGKLLYIQASGFSDTDEDGLDLGVSKTFTVEYDPLVWAELESRSRFIHQNRINGDKVPPAEARKYKDKKKQCKYCEYKQECDNFLPIEHKFINETKGDWETLKKLMPDDFMDIAIMTVDGDKK